MDDYCDSTRNAPGGQQAAPASPAAAVASSTRDDCIIPPPSTAVHLDPPHSTASAATPAATPAATDAVATATSTSAVSTSPQPLLLPSPSSNLSPISWATGAGLGSGSGSGSGIAPKASTSSPAAPFAAPASSTMIFSDIYKSPRSPLSKFRHPHLQLPTPLPTDTPDWVAEEYADLLSRDKAKQKEAVKRYLAAKVKNDWDFPWPSRVVQDAVANGFDERIAAEAVQESVVEDAEPVQDGTREDDGYQMDSEDSEQDDDTESVYSVVSEDPLHYRPRTEWASDLSDDDEPVISPSPFRFDNPDAVGLTVKASILAKRAERRRAVRKEMEWNEGLACFEARRNAWTGARTVRIRTKPVSPPAVSPRSPRRFFFRRSMSGSPPAFIPSVQSPTSGEGSDASSLAKSDGTDLNKQQTKDTTPSTSSSTKEFPVEALIPIAPPLLPPNNPLRASITPSVYLSLYDKLILNNLQPSCPINLSDMLRACVAGWKRDGEWPPRSTPINPTVVAARKKRSKPSQDGPASGGAKDIARRMSFGLLSRDKDDEAGTAKGIRKSLQRALGIGANGVHDTATGEKA